MAHRIGDVVPLGLRSLTVAARCVGMIVGLGSLRSCEKIVEIARRGGKQKLSQELRALRKRRSRGRTGARGLVSQEFSSTFLFHVVYARLRLPERSIQSRNMAAEP